MELFAVLTLTLAVLLKAAEAEPIQTGDFSTELARHPELKKYVDQAIAAVEARFEDKYKVLQGKLTEHETNNLALRKELSEYAIKQAKFESENTLLREELRKHTSSLEKFDAQNRLLQQQVDKLGEKLQRDSAKFNPSLQTNRINEKLETNVTEPMDYQSHHDIHDKLVKVVQEQNNYSRLKGNTRDGQRRMTRRNLMVRAEAVENRVAFFATLSNTMQHLGANQDIPFDHVITNVGNAYNGNHGTFIAPTTGVYLFATTLMHPWDHAESYGHFVVSGKVVAKLRVQNYQSSQTIIVRLNQGDDVSVQNTMVDKDFHGDSYSSFTGVLLYEDYSSPVVVG